MKSFGAGYGWADETLGGSLRTSATVTVNGQTFSYGYKNDTNLISSVSSGDVSTTFGYQSNNDNLLSITTSDSETNLFSAGYTYNADQQRQTESVTQANPDGSSSTQDQTYGYDAALELNSVTDSNTGASIFSATYDGAGNRNDSSFTSTYGTANGMNQYAGLVYNARGDLVNDGTLAYMWDAKDELTSETPDNPTTGSTEEEFQYDASDRRTEEDIYDYNATTGKWDAEADKVLKFAYQGNNLVAELDGSNHLITSLTWGVGGLLAVTDFTGSTPKTYQVIEDGSGNVVELVDPTNGAVAASYTYATYGAMLSATGPAVNVCPYRFAGLIFDGPGLNYYGDNRYYSPQLEKWISRDPIAEAGGLDTSEYANNDPIDYNDPTGLEPGVAAPPAVQPSPVSKTGPLWTPDPPIGTQAAQAFLQGQVAVSYAQAFIGPPGQMPMAQYSRDYWGAMLALDVQNGVLDANQANTLMQNFEVAGKTINTVVINGMDVRNGRLSPHVALDSSNHPLTVLASPPTAQWTQQLQAARAQRKAAAAAANAADTSFSSTGGDFGAGQPPVAPPATSQPSTQPADFLIVTVPRSKYPETAQHIWDAQAAGQPSLLTVDRLNAEARRDQALMGISKVAGKQLDEYPPAMFKEGGKGADVRPVDPGDNMSAGASIGNQLRGVKDGTQVLIRVIP